MNILIIGSGATGGLIGARLIERGAHVTFLVRPERKVQLLTRGLQLHSPFGRFRKPVHAVTPDEVNTHADLILVACRAHKLDEALRACAPAIGAETVLLPITEGVRHLEIATRTISPRVLAGVFEGRVHVDADGILSQRPPRSELAVGTVRDGDEDTAKEIAALLTGRGLLTTHRTRIRAKGWERFAFVASAVAATTLANRPLRDSLRFAHGSGDFNNLLREAQRIGTAVGYGPDQVSIKAYNSSFLLEGRPVQAPQMIKSGGRASDESFFLLSEMVAMARQARVSAFLFNAAWRTLMGPYKSEVSPDAMAETA